MEWLWNLYDTVLTTETNMYLGLTTCVLIITKKTTYKMIQ